MDTETSTTGDGPDFGEALKTMLPRLRIYALSLTRDPDAAGDLVHDTVVKALNGRNSFQMGTNLAAWLFRIARNEFISGLRRRRPSVPVDTVAESLSSPPHQENGLVMREFLIAFGKLTLPQREALLLSVLEGQSYEDIARHTSVSVGTVKSRVSRARDRLESLLQHGDESRRPARAVSRSGAVPTDESSTTGPQSPLQVR